MLGVTFCSFLPIVLSHIPELSIFTLLTLFFIVLSSNFSLLGWCSYIDEMSLAMILLLVFVISMTILHSIRVGTFMTNLLSLSYIITLIFFSTSSLVMFFVCFEASLIPLTVIVLLYGRQAERLMATQFLFLYTIIASAPLLWFVVSILSEGHTSLYFESGKGEVFSVLIISFLVKIPAFLFHSWLPKAHVEAPLEGSMLLAGIMLKVGMFGMVRMMSTFNISVKFSHFLFVLTMVGSILSSLLALSSDDMKMTVAYSSVSHMNVIIASLLSMKESGLISCVIVMVAHGISSPFLFFLVTWIYQLSGSRSSVVSKGVNSKFPFVWFVGVMLWVCNMAVPPFFPFLGELISFCSIVSFYKLSIFLVIMMMMMSSFYSMVNMGVQSHSSSKLKVKLVPADFLFFVSSSVSLVFLILLFLFCLPIN